MVGGFVVMGYSFVTPGLEAVLFVVGFFMTMASIALPIEYGYRGNRTRG
ncbi:hypothetical protein GCM10010968_14180 [Agrococcus terreus]|uniref:Uncharacterized protein n=2 Tax=Agrococcus terreus TaxID=574649 RepID=A0ABQ2KH66_9MICO|nr:hypothetical protein GCM10010968_14180 [Agrococcus terreus]